jgi:peptidoglycan/xylan/chitin deacetylase (PgdA/CDA1 family)
MLVVVGGLAIVVVALAVVVAHRGDGGRNAVLRVMIDRHDEAVPEGTTLARAASRFRLHPRAGNLVDVEGNVLRRGADPGRLLLNGSAAPPASKLRSGDRISVMSGRDRREPLSRQTVNVVGGLPPNPQFTLARTGGTAVVVRGAISHELVKTSFRPSDGRPASLAPDVALTFDDGPSPQYTPRILAVLRRLHVQATFFAVGYLVDWYPDLVRAELTAGMDVGNHSYNHPEVPPFDRLPARLRNDEVSLAGESLRRAGDDPTLFRPPGGSVSQAVVRAAARFGERVVLWSVDPGDWQRGTTPQQIVKRVLAAVRPGAIIVLHDGGGDRSATVAALPAIIKGVRRQGLRFVTTNGF